MESNDIKKGINESIRTLFAGGTAEQDRIIPLCTPQSLASGVYDENRWVEDRLVRFGLIDGDVSFKTFFLVERLTFPDHFDDKQRKLVLRPWAKHEEIPDAEYFPVILIKYNPSLCPESELRENEKRLRFVYPIRDREGHFTIPDEDKFHGALAHWNHQPFKYLLSKRLYEVRDKLTITQDTISSWLTGDFDGRGLFQEVRGQFKHFADLPEEWCALLALWTMGTHVHQLFAAYPYINLWAEHSSGKSRVLKVTAALAHMGKHVEDPSAAASFRMVDRISCTLCVDEVDKLDPKDNPELLGILNTGYEVGATVPRYNVDTKMLEEFNAFSPKMLASNRALPISLESRCLRIPIMRSSNSEFAHREPKDPSNAAILAELQEDLAMWAIDQGTQLFDMDRGAVQRKYESKFIGVPIRLFQVMTPILCVYELLGLDEEIGAYPSETANLKKVIEALGQEKKSASIPEVDADILIGLANAIEDSGSDTLTIQNIISAIIGLEPDKKHEESRYEAWKGQKKFFGPPKVGIILKKYAVPNRAVDGRKQYLPGKTRDERRAFIGLIMERFGVERSELNRVLSYVDDEDGLDKYSRGDQD